MEIYDKIQLMKKRRIFIAIDLPQDIKEQFFNFRKKWPDLPCRWQEKDNLHLTLAFLGDINEKELNKVVEITKQVAEQNSPFSISFDKICYGPGEKIPPRLVWIEGQISKPVLKLKQNLEKSLAEKTYYKPEKRDFTPHVTLGRIRKWDWKKIEPDERPKVETEILIKVPVDSIEVMESHLKRTGAEYTVLETYSLRSRNT